MMTDRNLEEAIFQLQKLNTENGVKRLVEEAAHLFASGHHIEAGALMEKAEAMIAAKNGQTTPANHSSSKEPPKPEDKQKVDEQAMVNMAGKLADGLSKILTGAFQELERHIVGESRKLSASFEHQLERLQASVDSLVQLKNNFEQLSSAVAEQKTAGAAMAQKYEHLSAGVTVLQDTSTRHENEIVAMRGDTTSLRAEAAALRGETTALRGEAKESSAAFAQQVDGLAARIGLHQEELVGLKSTMSEISRKVAGFIERVDRQGDVIRALNDTQARRAAALDEMLNVITRLKAPPAEAMVAVAASQV